MKRKSAENATLYQRIGVRSRRYFQDGSKELDKRDATGLDTAPCMMSISNQTTPTPPSFPMRNVPKNELLLLLLHLHVIQLSAQFLRVRATHEQLLGQNLLDGIFNHSMVNKSEPSYKFRHR